MTEEEYEKAIDDLLKTRGGSYDRPSGWLADGLAFSCDTIPVTVFFASLLTSEQRTAFVENLRETLAKD